MDTNDSNAASNNTRSNDADDSNATSNDPRSDNVNTATSVSSANISNDDDGNVHNDNSSGHSSETIYDTNVNSTPTDSHDDTNDAIKHSYDTTAGRDGDNDSVDSNSNPIIDESERDDNLDVNSNTDTDSADLTGNMQRELLSDWVEHSRRSNRFGGRDPDPNFTFATIGRSGDDSNNVAHGKDGDASFAAAHTNDDDAKETSLASFQEECVGGMSLFQQCIDPSLDTSDDALRDLNLSFDRASLQNKVDEFLITDDPMPLQHHLVGVLLNQMSAKKCI